MKRNAIFYRTPNSQVGWDAPDEYKSKEQILARIKERGWTLATKKDYDSYIYNMCFPRIKKALEEEHIEEVLSILRSNDNTYSMTAFENVTGVKLSRVWKHRLEQLKEYFGEKYTTWETKKREAARELAEHRQAEAEAKRKAEIEEAENKWLNGEAINGEQFQILCALHEIELHIRTKGYCNKRLMWAKNTGDYMHKKGAICQGFCDAFLSLKRKTIAAA